MKFRKFGAVLTAAFLLVTGTAGCGHPTVPADTTERPTVITVPDFGTDTGMIKPSDTTAPSEPVSHTGTTAVPNDTTKKPDVPVTPKKTETRISFLAAGDNIIHENLFLDAKERAGKNGGYDFLSMYDDIAPLIASADLAFVNQETPLGGDELGISGYPNFNGPQAAGDALVELGFNLVNIATNHMLDKQAKGLEGTIRYFDSQPVTLLGGYLDDADYENIRVVEEQGVKIAFLTYTYGLNGMSLPSGSRIHIPLIDEKEIVRMIDRAEEISDFVIVVMHWGTENSFSKDAEQQKLSKSLSDAGADVILGMHSHTVQPMEWIQNSDGTRTLCIYSLGNLIHTMRDNFNLVGGIVTFDIVKKADGETVAENPVYNPTVNHYDGNIRNIQVCLLEHYTEKSAQEHGIHQWGWTTATQKFSLDIAKKYVTDSIPTEFLPDFLK